MNIFVLHENPVTAAEMVCDSHSSKMCVEGVQMLVGALLISGAPADQMPLTTRGQPHKGGYLNHPCTQWVAEAHRNFWWLFNHTRELCRQFKKRYGKEHFAFGQLEHLIGAFRWGSYIPVITVRGENGLDKQVGTPFMRCLNQSENRNLDLLDEDKYTAVEAYREFYLREKAHFAKWDKGVDAPSWWVEGLKERKDV